MEEYQKLVEDHHNMIYFFLHKNHLPIDDFYGDAAIGLCKAGMEYDPSLGYAFTSFAYKCMFNEVGREIRRRCRLENGLPQISYEGLISGEANLRLEDVLSDGYISCGEAVESSSFIVWFIGQLSERDLEILYWRLQGKSMREIGDIIGFSRQTVLNRMRWMQKVITTNSRVHTLPRDHSKRSEILRDKIIQTLSYNY